MSVTIQINGMEVRASVEVLRQILQLPQQKLGDPQRQRTTPEDYDGRGPAHIPSRKKAEPHHKVKHSSGNFWTDEENAILLEHFPMSRDTTPPESSIKKMKHLLPGRSAAAIQVRWYTLKKKEQGTWNR